MSTDGHPSSNPRVPYRFDGSGPEPRMPAGELLVHLVVNVEHWPFDQAMPRALLPAPHGVTAVPDIPNFSWVEYGMRRGLPRIMDLMAHRGVVASVSLNAAVLDVYPELTEPLQRSEWKVIGHGWSQRGLTEADEVAAVERALARLESGLGRRPTGWLGPGLKQTSHTPDVLAAAGITHVFDWTIDDVPAWMTTQSGPIVAIPYSLEVNDSVVYAVERHADGELERRAGATAAVYRRECEREARILTVGLHPHLMGVPHRIDELARIIDDLVETAGARFVTGSQIDSWFRDVRPSGPLSS